MVTAAKSPRGRRSKVEVQQSLDAVIQETQESQNTMSSIAETAQKLREEEIHAAVDHLTVETVITHLSSLNSEISKTLSDFAAKITREVDLLSHLREAVNFEKKELERLHKIDVGATAIAQLLEDYANKRIEHEKERDMLQAKWDKEKQDKQIENKELEDSLKKVRQREQEEYDYKKNLERKKAQDQFDEMMRLKEKQSQEKFETLEKQWQEREKNLKINEKAHEDSLRTIEEFSVKLKKETDAAVAHALKENQQKYSQEILLLKKDADSDKRLAEMKIKTLEETLQRQSAQVEILQTQVEQAKKQVEEIAVKAIEGASGARALAHVNQIAIEQAKTRTSNT